MNTILMAAARGARIQVCRYEAWEDTDFAPAREGSNYLPRRIHPDDEHLRFGPISTALREMAETCKYPYTDIGVLAETLFNLEWGYPIALLSDWPHAQIFLLLLSEIISEEGL